jgi:hypothetical protein
VRFRRQTEKVRTLARRMVTNRASGSAVEQIFALGLRDAREFRTCGRRATMRRESALKAP